MLSFGESINPPFRSTAAKLAKKWGKDQGVDTSDSVLPCE